MKILKLTKGKETIIDDEDYEKVKDFKWYYHSNHYAVANDKKTKKKILIHRLIMNCPKGLQIDHINGNKLDNRKSNLRIVNFSQNQMNSKKGNNTYSKYKGVTWNKRCKKWLAQIMFNGKNIFLGYFDCEIKAARAYNKAVLTYFKEFAKLNKL